MDKLITIHLGARIVCGGKQWLAAAAMVSVMLLAASAVAQKSEVEGLEVLVRAVKREYGRDEAINVEVTFKNNSDAKLTILKWNTPFEGFRSDMFIVQDEDGNPVRYIGRLYRRGRPTAQNYLEIPPGDLRKKVLDLSEAYAIRKAGQYTVQLKTRIQDYGRDQTREALVDRKQLRPFYTESNIARFEQRRRRRARREMVVTPFLVCSPGQEQELKQTHLKALEAAWEALRVLKETAVADRPGSNRYKHWFGEYSASNWGTVTTYFEQIAKALKEEDITLSCDCYSTNDLAFVVPGVPDLRYKIWVCGPFWETPTTDTGSRLVTIMHEMFHFFVTEGVGHHALFRKNCENLASSSDPDKAKKAVQNGDSYGFCAENDPPL